MSARQYEILGILGRGGFGTVYKARYVGEAGFEKLVAIKVLNADMSTMEEIGQRLRDEARVLGRLRHRAVVGVDRLSRLDGRWAVVMEYVEGISLELVLKRAHLDFGPALDIGAELASALHVASVTPGPDGAPLLLQHRDLKPANVQLTRHGEVKLLDFGIARAELGSREAKTRSLFFGTPEYMAPERFRHIDVPAGDIWSLGAMLAEMLTGQRVSVSSGVQREHGAVLDELRERLESATVPGALTDLLQAMLAFTPEARPDAGAVMRAMLELRRSFSDEPLQTWCAREIPTLMVLVRPPPADALVGRVLEESQITGTAGLPSVAPFVPPVPALASPSAEPSSRPVVPTVIVEPAAPRSSWVRWAALSLVLVVGLGAGAGLLVWLVRSHSKGQDSSNTLDGLPADIQGGFDPVPPLQLGPVALPAENVPVAEERPSTSEPDQTPSVPVQPGGSTRTRADLEKERVSKVVLPAPEARPPQPPPSQSNSDACAEVSLKTPDVIVTLIPKAIGERRRDLPGAFAAGDYRVEMLTSEASRPTKVGELTLVCGKNVSVTCDTSFKTCSYD